MPVDGERLTEGGMKEAVMDEAGSWGSKKGLLGACTHLFARKLTLIVGVLWAEGYILSRQWVLKV